MPFKYGQRNDGNRDVILTFDDGPSLKNTPRLLDILAENGISVLFFFIGNKMVRPDGASIVRRVLSEGHKVGNHTFSHPNLRNLPKEKIRDELIRTHELICECADACQYFRPPYGVSSEHVSEVVNELGYRTVLWNVDSLDWKLKKEGSWVENTMNQIKAREDSIVLMHEIHKSTVDNVGRLIRRVKRIKGHRFTQY